MMDMTELGDWALKVLAALAVGGLVVKFAISRRDSKRSALRITSQRNNVAGGDIIGGDSVKKGK